MFIADAKTVSATASSVSATRGERNLVSYLVIGAELVLFIALIHQFQLETSALVRLMMVALGGWAVHYFLPRRYRLPFFVVLSFTGIFVVLGSLGGQLWFGGMVDGLWLVAVGLALMGLCHLPIALGWRVLLLLAAGAGLAAMRSDWFDAPWSGAVWPVLASMFMFRLIVYVYEIRREKNPATLSERLAYFFMLPNICFPLFPVVDFQTFRSSYYNHSDRHYIYQTGIEWLFRGALHLILYRIVYQNFVIDASEVQDRTDLIQYLLWPFLLYLKVSGTFHIITGLLHLFGFNLPETHKLYYLSSSFTDFWRRINIYWKDFIMKIFYYPLFFRFRRWGERTALVLATILAFVATWLLHNYQWFWLRGTWVFTWNDFIFWMTLAALVTVNALYEMRHGRKRRLKGKALDWREALSTAAKTVGVFFVISVLWSFWSASSVTQWLSVFDAAGVTGPHPAIPILVLVAAAAIIGLPAIALARGAVDRPYQFGRSALTAVVPAALAVCISFPAVHERLGAGVSTAVAEVSSSDLNRRDHANLERGYYENLVDVGGFSPELWMRYAARPAHWPLLTETPLVEFSDGLPAYYLRPQAQAEFRGAHVTINQWGMRDQNYEKVPPPKTLRIAILGSSHVFGLGVGDNETFESIVERRLNEEVAGSGYDRYELLNFAVGGYNPLDVLAMLEDRVFEFAPDYIIYFEHSDRVRGMMPDLVRAIQNGSALRYDFVREAVRAAGVDPTMDEGQISRKLAPYGEDLLTAIYTRYAEVTKARGVGAFWIFLPRVEGDDQPEKEIKRARDAGNTVLDLSGAYEGHELASLIVAPWDMHPNALGHRLIADKFYQVLKERADLIPLRVSGVSDIPGLEAE